MSKPRGLQSHNGTLTDYADISGHHAEGIIFPSHNCTPREPPTKSTLEGYAELNIWPLFRSSICVSDRRWVSGKEPPRCGREWASARPHYSDEWGHKLMSLTYCTYLFLCVTMTHYALKGIKHPHWYQEMHYMVRHTHDTWCHSFDLGRNFTSHFRNIHCAYRFVQLSAIYKWAVHCFYSCKRVKVCYDLYPFCAQVQSLQCCSFLLEGP